MDFHLKKYEDEAKEITDFLSKPDAFSDSSFASKSKRLSELNEILALGREIEQMEKNISDANDLLSDPDFAEMAKADIDEANKKIVEDSEKLEEMLIPRDPNDDKPAIMEIRAGAGGDEASFSRASFIACMFVTLKLMA